MKIGPLDTKPIPTPAPVERKKLPAPMPMETGAEPSAQVALSPAATLLSGLAADPAFDSAKVDRIAKAIREGKFTVNADAIATKLIVNAEELLGRKIN
jgi:negative regulator of flagellin synthesis FlgM